MSARKKPADDQDTQGLDMPFEDALKRLETIVEELEGGELTLEQSLAHYEEGMRLSRGLGKTLDEAEKRIERLVAARGDGKPTTRPMEDEPEDANDEGSSGRLPF